MSLCLIIGEECCNIRSCLYCSVAWLPSLETAGMERARVGIKILCGTNLSNKDRFCKHKTYYLDTEYILLLGFSFVNNASLNRWVVLLTFTSRLSEKMTGGMGSSLWMWSHCCNLYSVVYQKHCRVKSGYKRDGA